LHRIYAHASHPRQIDHQTTIADRITGDIVGTNTHCNQKFMRACEFDGINDVDNPTTACDQRGPPVDHAVPDFAGILITGLAGAEEPPP
jgi:hypothetical protein